MDNDRKLKIAKNIILAGWIVAILGASSILYWRLNLTEYGEHSPIWILPFFILGSILLLAGVLLGSRGRGVPLDTERLISLCLGYPCWIAAALYIGLMVFYRFL
jgi:hypothetical protein